KEILFSIFYMDQHLDFHLSDSIDDFEKLLQTKATEEFALHVECRELNALIEKFGPLNVGEIYGYSDAVFDEEVDKISASHTISPKQEASSCKQNVQIYFSRLCTKFKEGINKSYDDFYTYPYDEVSYNFSRHFMISYN